MINQPNNSAAAAQTDSWSTIIICSITYLVVAFLVFEIVVEIRSGALRRTRSDEKAGSESKGLGQVA